MKLKDAKTLVATDKFATGSEHLLLKYKCLVALIFAIQTGIQIENYLLPDSLHFLMFYFLPGPHYKFDMILAVF